MRAAVLAFIFAQGSPCFLSAIRVGEWRTFSSKYRHASHQSSDLRDVRPDFRAGLAPYQEIPLAPREPDKLPPYVGSPATPECVEVYQADRSLSARNQLETCADWALGMYWLSSDSQDGRGVWSSGRGPVIRFVDSDTWGWWIHRDLDRHGLPCMGAGSERSPDPLGCTGFGEAHWSACKVRRCPADGNARLRAGNGGHGLEGKLRSMKTPELRSWAENLGISVGRDSRRAEITAQIREFLFLRDGHLQLDPIDAFLATSDAWSRQLSDENRAIEAAEAAAEQG